MSQILILLTMAVNLLIAANQPYVPASLKQTAISVANTAIEVANKAIADSKKSPIPVSSPKPPPIQVSKVLRVTPDKSYVWATEYHYAGFSFEYLEDGKPVETQVRLKTLSPNETFLSAWQSFIPSSKKFSYFTPNVGNHTLTFITDNGVEGQAIIEAKKWPDRKDLEIIPIKTSSRYETTNDGSDLGSIFLGSFKVRSNPDVGIRFSYCDFSVYTGNVTYEFYTITGLSEQQRNDCSSPTGHTVTDSDGISLKEFSVYVSGVKVKNFTPGNSANIRFNLKDILVYETAKNDIHKSTTTLSFDLELTRYK